MLDLAILAGFLTLGFFVGGAREKKHFNELIQREAKLLSLMPTRSVVGKKIEAGEVFLVNGNVVVASDYFKDFVGSLKSFFGGRMKPQEALMDRARREAVCRLREKALELGAQEVVDLHIQTSFLDQQGVEVSAYATAIKR